MSALVRIASLVTLQQSTKIDRASACVQDGKTDASSHTTRQVCKSYMREDRVGAGERSRAATRVFDNQTREIELPQSAQEGGIDRVGRGSET